MMSAVEARLEYDFRGVIDKTLATNAVFAFCLLLSVIVDIGNSYSGFTGVMYGFQWLAYLPLAFYVVRVSPTRALYGVVLGCGVWLVVLSLMQAIYYGQASGCSVVARRSLLSAECAHPSAQKSACVFSVFLFLGGGVLQFLLLRHKDYILPGPMQAPVGAGGSSYEKVAAGDL